jgi:hypothetical protein
MCNAAISWTLKRSWEFKASINADDTLCSAYTNNHANPHGEGDQKGVPKEGNQTMSLSQWEGLGGKVIRCRFPVLPDCIVLQRVISKGGTDQFEKTCLPTSTRTAVQFVGQACGLSSFCLYSVFLLTCNSLGRPMASEETIWPPKVTLKMWVWVVVLKLWVNVRIRSYFEQPILKLLGL